MNSPRPQDLEFKVFSNPNYQDNDKFYIKLLEKTTLDLKCIDCSGEIINTKQSIYFITQDIYAYENESIIQDIVLCKNIEIFIYYMKRAGRHNVKYKTCKVVEDNYTAKNNETFIACIEQYYPYILKYINNKADSINQGNVEKTLTERKQNIRSRDGVSSYRGVKVISLNPGRFCVNINKDKKRYYLGSYKIEKLAAYAYDCKAKELYGDDYKKINYVEKPKGYYWDKEKERVLEENQHDNSL